MLKLIDLVDGQYVWQVEIEAEGIRISRWQARVYPSGERCVWRGFSSRYNDANLLLYPTQEEAVAGAARELESRKHAQAT